MCRGCHICRKDIDPTEIVRTGCRPWKEYGTMRFDTIESNSLTELFVEQLEDKIFTGELKPGDRLPPERRMAAEMGISQTIVNNGLSILAGRGLVTIIPRRGTFVADYLNDGGLETLSALIHYARKKLPDSIMKDMTQFRFTVETFLFQEVYAITRREEREEIMKSYDTIAACLDDPSAFADNWYQTIRSFSIRSGNIICQMIINGFQSLYLSVMKNLCEKGDPAVYLPLIKAVFQAFVEGDFDSLNAALISYEAYECSILWSAE